MNRGQSHFAPLFAHNLERTELVFVIEANREMRVRVPPLNLRHSAVIGVVELANTLKHEHLPPCSLNILMVS